MRIWGTLPILICTSLIKPSQTAVICLTCPMIGYYNSGCNDINGGTCAICDSCATGYARTNCTGQSAGTCVQGTPSFSMVGDSESRLRKLDLSTAYVSTVGPTLVNPASSIAVSCDGTFALVILSGNHYIRKLDFSTGVYETFAGQQSSTGSKDGIGEYARFKSPSHIEMSPNCKEVWIADASNHLIRKADIENRTVTTVAGTSVMGNVDGPALSSSFDYPQSIAVSSNQSFLLVVDGQRVRMITLSGAATTVPLAGDSVSSRSTPGYVDGYGLDARFVYPVSICLSSDDAVAYVGDTFSAASRVRKIVIATKMVSTLVPLSIIIGPIGLAILPYDNYILVTSNNDAKVYLVSTASGSTSVLAGDGIVSSRDGRGTDAAFNRISKITVWGCRIPGMGYVNGLFDVCVPCPIGTYGPGNGKCNPCFAGTYTPSTGQSECKTCANGTYSNTGQVTACSTCSSGTFLSYTGATFCSTCSPKMIDYCAGKEGYRQGNCTSTADSICIPCPSIPANSHFVPSQTYECLWECNDAHFKTSPNQCQPCSTSLVCGIGKYQSVCGTTIDIICLNCTNGPSNSVYTSGSTQNSNNCNWKCDKGYFQDILSCSQCAKGSYTPTYGYSACLDCSGLTYASATGSTTCTACAPPQAAGQYTKDCGGTAAGTPTLCTRKPTV